MKKATLLLLFLLAIIHGWADNAKEFDFGFTRGKDIYLWPLIYREKNEDVNNLHVFFSIYRNSQNFKLNTQTQHFLPFYVHLRSNQGFDRRFISLYYPSIFRYNKEYNNEINTYQFLSIAPKINFVEVIRSHNRLLSATNVFPLVWHSSNKLEDKSHLFILPFYYETQEKHAFTRTLFPLFSYGKTDSASRYLAITPLYWQSSKPTELSRTFFPLLWYKKHFTEQKTTTDFTFFPVVWNEKSHSNLDNGIQSSSSDTYVFPTISFGKELSTDYKGRVASKFSKFFIHPIVYLSTSSYNSYDACIKCDSASLLKKDAINKTAKLNIVPLYFSKYDKYTSIYKQGDSVNHIEKGSRLRHRVVFPIYWQYPNSLSVLPLFSQGSHHLMITPLYWHFDNHHNRQLSTLFPLYWNYQRPDFYFHGIMPLYGYGKSTEGRQLLAITPLFWDNKDSIANSRLTMFLPLAWRKKAPNLLSHGFMPFYSYREKYGEHLLATTPLIWNAWDDSYRSTYIFPIFWNKTELYKTEKVNKSIVFPIWWSRSDKLLNTRKTTESYHVLFPVVWHYYNRGKLWRTHQYSNTETFTVFPLWWSRVGYSLDSASNKTGINSSHVLFPVFWKRNNPQIESTSLFPLYFNKYNKLSHQKTLLITPLYFSNETFKYSKGKYLPEKKSTFIFPSFVSSTNVAYPHKQAPVTTKSTTVFPLVFYKNVTQPYLDKSSEEEDARLQTSLTVFPLWYSKMRDSAVSYRVLFPIYWQFEKSLTIFPLFSYGSNYVGITPLFWRFKSATSSSLSLLPLWHYSHDTLTKVKNLVVTPLFWQLQNPKYSSTTLLPFFSVGSNPGKTKKHLNIIPLYWSATDELEQRSTLFPIWWSGSQKRENRIDFSYKVAFPLYWHFTEGTSRKSSVFPLWWSGSSTQDSVQKKYKILFPLLWAHTSTHYQNFTFFPLYSAGHNSNGTSRYTAVTPLFWNVNSSGVHTQTLVPLYFVRHDSAQQKSVVNILGLLFDYRKKEDSHTYNVLFPIVGYRHNATEKAFRLFPLVWTKQGEAEKYFHLIPVYSQLSDTASTSRYIVGPLYHQRNATDEVQRSMLWYLWQWNNKESQDYQFRILYRFIYSEQWEGVQTYGFMPFFHISKSENSSFSKNFGLGFYSQFRRKVVGYENEFYEETRIFWFLRIRSNYNHLKSKGIDVK